MQINKNESKTEYIELQGNWKILPTFFYKNLLPLNCGEKRLTTKWFFTISQRTWALSLIVMFTQLTGCIGSTSELTYSLFANKAVNLSKLRPAKNLRWHQGFREAGVSWLLESEGSKVIKNTIWKVSFCFYRPRHLLKKIRAISENCRVETDLMTRAWVTYESVTKAKWKLLPTQLLAFDWLRQ